MFRVTKPSNSRDAQLVKIKQFDSSLHDLDYDSPYIVSWSVLLTFEVREESESKQESSQIVKSSCIVSDWNDLGELIESEIVEVCESYSRLFLSCVVDLKNIEFVSSSLAFTQNMANLIAQRVKDTD